MDFDQITTWDQYVSAIADFGINRSEIATLDLGGGQKAILVAHYNNEKKTTNITFQYLYQTPLGKYAYWSWSGERDGDHSSETIRLKQLFSSLSYPGQLFLK